MGLGATIPEDLKDGDLKRQKLDSNDLLRRQLLGKDHAKLQNKSANRQVNKMGTGGVLPVGSKPRPTAAKREAEDVSSDDEGGRSQLGKKRRRDAVDADKHGGIDEDHGELGKERKEDVKYSKKATSYLDEVLSRKKKKKHQGKKRKKVDSAAESNARS